MRPIPSGGRSPKHHPIEYEEGINEAFTEVSDVSCEIGDDGMEGCIVRTDGELIEVDLDYLEVYGTSMSTAPHMRGTYEGTQYQMNHGPDRDTEYTRSYSDVWFDISGMDQADPQTCVVATNEDGTSMVCGDERTPLASLDPMGEMIDSNTTNPFRNPEEYGSR